MNCRQAETQLLAARDGALAEPVAADLAAHLEACPSCRALQARLDETFAQWQHETTSVPVPDPQTEWFAVRRRLRQETAAPSGLVTWSRLLRVAAPLTAVAAIALIVWQGRTPSSAPLAPELAALSSAPDATIADTPATDFDGSWPEMDEHFAFTAHAEYVETDNEDASPFVYVDDESGWLIVWASDPPDAASI